VQYLLESAVGNPSTAHAFDGSRHWDRCQFVCMQVVQACVFARAPRSKAVLWRMKTPTLKKNPGITPGLPVCFTLCLR
jgi:hypothetical protein